MQLARLLGLAPSTAGIYVERLIQDGFLEETDKASSEMGRPPVMLNLNPEAGEFIGVDIEATVIMAVAVDFADRPLRKAQMRISDNDSAETVIEKIEKTVERVFPEDPSRLLAIGVGVPGLVNSTQGVSIYYKYIANWSHVPLSSILEKRFNVPVYLENNVRSMALAELWFGQCLGVKDFLCVGIRSGIGVGIIIDGKLYKGSNYGAGELGRWQCPFPSRKASNWFAAGETRSVYGCELQEMASARAILRALETAIASGQRSVLESRAGSISLQDLREAVQQRDPLTEAVIKEVAQSLGWAIGQLVHIFDPKTIVLAGPLTMLGDNLLLPLREVINQFIGQEGRNPVEINNSTMGEYSAALGAAALALHEWKPFREAENGSMVAAY